MERELKKMLVGEWLGGWLTEWSSEFICVTWLLKVKPRPIRPQV
jgi:hypothetical protein